MVYVFKIKLQQQVNQIFYYHLKCIIK